MGWGRDRDTGREADSRRSRETKRQRDRKMRRMETPFKGNLVHVHRDQVIRTLSKPEYCLSSGMCILDGGRRA